MNIRKARASDAAHLVRFINMAADDLPLHFWRKTVGPEGDPWALGQERAARETGNFSYRNAWLAEVDGAVRAAGLDPCLGFLHEIAYGRPALSLDLLEPLRGPLGDLHVLRLLNHQLLQKGDFEFRADDGGTYLTREARAKYLHEYERTMTRRFAPEKNAPHTDFRGVIREQVAALLRAMEKARPPEFFQMP